MESAPLAADGLPAEDDRPKGGYPVRPSALEGAWRSVLPGIDIEAFTEADHARLMLSGRASRLAWQAIHLAQTWVDRERHPAALVTDALELADVAAKTVDDAVVSARCRGASWDDIGAHAHMSRQSAHTRWGPAEARWRDQRSAHPTLVHPGSRAAGLDAWLEHVSDPVTDPRVPHDRRVSAALDATVDRSGHRAQQAARVPEGRAWNLIDRYEDVSSRHHRRVAGFLALVYACLLHDIPSLAPDENALPEREGVVAKKPGDFSTGAVDAACSRLDLAAREFLAQEPSLWRTALERFVAGQEELRGHHSPHVAYWHDAVRETTGADGFAHRKGFPVNETRRLLSVTLELAGE